MLAGLASLGVAGAADVAAELPRATPVAVATQDAGGGKTIRVTRISAPPVIDGRLDDAAWETAPQVNNFHQIRPIEFSAPSQRTDVYVLYDEDTLYIGARMWEAGPGDITANILRQGQRLTMDDDRFGVVLSPFNDGQSGYAFYVNPNSVRDSAIFQETSFMRWEWDGIFRAAAVRDDRGWTAEMAIPFKTLSFDPRITDWGISFQRAIAREREFIGWTSANREINPSVLGVLEGVDGPRQGHGLDIVPGLALKSRRDDTGGSTEYRFEPSLDAYYKLTPGLNLAVTLNTDFSASEVDERQVNLTRFGLFFPEKRDFFLQDADIFEFGRLTSAAVYDTTFSQSAMENGKPYFSRTIGLSPAGQPVDLVGGTRLSGRAGGMSVGAMIIRQDSFEDIETSDLLVGRVVINVLDQSNIGLLATRGNPRSNEDNSVIGADFRYRNPDFMGQILQAELWHQRSNSADARDKQDAWGARATIPSWTGWRGSFGVKEIGENFRPGMGFVNRRGVRDVATAGGYTARFGHGPVESWFSGVDAQRFTRLSDDSLQTQVVTLRLAELTSRAGDRLTVRYTANEESLREPFGIFPDVTIPPGRYAFNETAVRVSRSARRELSGYLGYRGGDFYGGDRMTLDGQLTWRPSPHFWGALGYNFNRVDLPEGDFIIRAMQARGGIVVSAQLAWENFVQYDSVSTNIGINSRLTWIPEAGQQLMLVINHGLLEDEITARYQSAERDSAISFKYTFRF
jgi:hypothetical protein